MNPTETLFANSCVAAKQLSNIVVLPDNITMRVETSFAAVEELREQWDKAVARLGGPVYMTYDWLKIWWEFYGHAKQLRLFLFQAGDGIVGLIPIYLDRLGIGPFHLTVARFVGANIPPKIFDPPVHPEWVVDCFERMLRQLLTEDQCDVISLGPVSDQYAPWAKFPEVCARLSVLAQHVTRPPGVHAVFHLPKTFEDYLQSLGKNEQKNRRRYYELGNLKKLYSVKVDVLSSPDADLLGEFERFAVQHRRQWEPEGKAGHFGSWPDALAYNRALVNAQGRLGRVRFVRIWADNHVVATIYAFAFAGRWFCELPSREFGEEWNRFSLGQASLVTTFGEAIKEGVHRVEGGLGHYEYKTRLKAEEYPAQVFRVVSRRAASKLRQRIFDALRLLLAYGYHKLWYRRIMTRLPAVFRKPQWRLWLRLDF